MWLKFKILVGYSYFDFLAFFYYLFLPQRTDKAYHASTG